MCDMLVLILKIQSDYLLIWLLFLYGHKNIPPAMPVCPQLALASRKKPPMI